VLKTLKRALLSTVSVMTKNNSVALVNGSLSVRSGSGKVKNITRSRHFFGYDAFLAGSTQVLSGEQSPYSVGSQYTNSTLIFSADKLTTNARAWIQQHDRYRVKEVEVLATLVSNTRGNQVDKTLPVEVYFYEDTDADSTTETSWIRVCDRDNLGRVVLNAFTPAQKLISFKPTASFAATATSSQNPANMLPSKNQWIDALNVKQQLSGLRVFSCCPQADSTGNTYGYSLCFQTRYHVEVQQPL